MPDLQRDNFNRKVRIQNAIYSLEKGDNLYDLWAERLDFMSQARQILNFEVRLGKHDRRTDVSLIG